MIFDACKRIIEKGQYDEKEMVSKINRLHIAKKITLKEKKELTALMNQ